MVSVCHFAHHQITSRVSPQVKAGFKHTWCSLQDVKATEKEVSGEVEG